MVSARQLQAVILTKNEEPNIRRVLDKLHWLTKIVVIDSYSTDETLDILRSYVNVEVHQRAFDTHAIQWNFGIDFCNSKWILSLDADYVLNDAFVEEVSAYIHQETIVAYNAQFEFLVFGKPLRGNNTMPRPVLFQKDKCRYYDDGHTQRLRIDGREENFKNKIDHDDRKPLSRWLQNQAGYSLKESRMLGETPQKQLSFTSKLRKTKILAPIFIFFYCLFIKGLIFNGWRGWHYTLQRTLVEILLALRLTEQDHFEQ